MKKRRLQGKLFNNNTAKSRSSINSKRKQLFLDNEPPKQSIFAWLFTWITAFFTFSRQQKDYSKDVNKLGDRLEILETSIMKLTKQVNKLQRHVSSLSVSSGENKNSTVVASSIPPPPMSIPPPPPLSFPIQSNQVSSTVPAVKAKIAKRGVSMLDLQNVKLKKRKSPESSSVTKPTSKQQLVTLKDLQNVKLKRRIVEPDVNTNLPSPKTTNKVKSLRKTNIVRSPGGTPMVPRNQEQTTGEGLTPAFTKALRRKFQSIQVSPLEKSPSQWRC